MHNRTKIKIFRIACWVTYPLALVIIYPLTFFKKKKSNLIFFFDRYSIGGAQRVHLDILESVKDTYKEVYFTRRSGDASLKEAFQTTPHAKIADIHFYCDNLLIRLFTVHFYASYINRHKKMHVFSSNSTFFYDLLPFLRRDIITTELLHNFTYGKKGMEFFGLANHQYLSSRILIDNYTLQNIKKQYAEYAVDNMYIERLILIEPGVNIPAQNEKNFDLPLKVLYAGRGGAQKRVWLISKIAEYFLKENLPVEFHFAGNMENDLSAFVIENSTIHGIITDEKKMQGIYHQCHVIILTSAYEGFPMVIKEGMANSCIPVITALEGNKTHLVNNVNALLINNFESEDAVVKQGIEQLNALMKNKLLLERLSINCREYAIAHFDIKIFEDKMYNFLKNQ